MSQYSTYNKSFHPNSSQSQPGNTGSAKTGVDFKVDEYERMMKENSLSEVKRSIGRVDSGFTTNEDHSNRPINHPVTVTFPGPWSKELLEASQAYNPSGIDELEVASDTYPQIDLIPIQMTAQPDSIWNFCVAYCSAAMTRRAQPEETINLLNGQPVGLYYLAALTLFYSIEEASLGRIPPIQMMSPQLAELFYEVAPINKKGKAYTPVFDDDIVDLIHTRPYFSFENRPISLAPHTGLILPSGLPQISNVIPLIGLDDLREQGPLAFEKVQRYFLGKENPDLVPYTPGSGNSTGAMFAAFRDLTTSRPVRGVSQVVNEIALPQRAYKWVSLAFFAAANSRDGWTTRTVQKGTHLAIIYLMTGKDYKKCITHMINLSTITADALANFIVAEVNSDPDFSIEDLTQQVPYDPGFLSQMTPGQLLSVVLAIASRRFWLSSACCAGTPMMANSVEVIGAGSQYITSFQVDTAMSFQTSNEQLADLSRFEDTSQVLHLPVLVIKGRRQVTNYWNPGSDSILNNLIALYPQADVISYAMKSPLPGDLPSVLDLDVNNPVCFTLGPAVDRAIRVYSNTAAALQGSNAISVGTDGRDGTGSRSCFITHYIEFKAQGVNSVDTTPIQNVQFILSKKRFSGKTISTQLNHLFPVMYEQYDPLMTTDSSLPAFQTLTYSDHAAAVDVDYYDMRASTWAANGHKLAANALMPSGVPLYSAHRIIMDEGGNFVDSFFKGGQWVNTASLISKGIMSLVAPELADSVSDVVGKGARAVHDMFSGGKGKSKLSALHLAPVTNGFVSKREYVSHIDFLEKYAQINQEEKMRNHSLNYVLGKQQQKKIGSTPLRGKKKQNNYRRKR